MYNCIYFTLLQAVSSRENQASVSNSVSVYNTVQGYSYYSKMYKCCLKKFLFSSSFSDIW